MTKIACITDTHFGAKKSSVYFQEYQKKCFKWFFDYLDKESITNIIHLGDVYDVRPHVNYSTAKLSKDIFYNPIVERGIQAHIICGNHDQFYKDTHEVNSLDELITGRYVSNIHTYTRPSVISMDDLDLLLLPWITDSNKAESLEAIQNPRASFLFGHLELKDFTMHKGHIATRGMDMKMFENFDKVFSGHYHHKSTIGNVTYIGSFLDITWSDLNDPRGFSVFDTETGEMKFIENPHKLFKVSVYNDEAFSYDILDDMSEFKDKFIKVIVENRTNPATFDLFLESIYKVGPLDLEIIENAAIINGDVDLDIGEVHDTPTIISGYIDGLTLNINSDKLKSYMYETYQEALQTEIVE